MPSGLSLLPPSVRHWVAPFYIVTHASFKVILVYDHVLSLRREISHVWRLRFSLPKLLFLLVSNPFVIWKLYLIQGVDTIPSPSGILPRPSFTH